MYERLLPLLSRMDAETAHHLTLALLRLAKRLPPVRPLLRRRLAVNDPRLAVRAFGLDFANPIGLAAGFDKNGVAPGVLASLGFGHIEIGTVTPRPQAGHPRPRIFRLPEDRALVNRLGFPNQGALIVRRRLPAREAREYVLGVNVGPNAAGVAAGKADADYVRCLDLLSERADYLVINVSSPNTQGLHLLQAVRTLDALLAALFQAVSKLDIDKPLLLKLAPDLTDGELVETLRVATAHPVAAIVATNTTVSRPAGMQGRSAQEAGGLSGRPLAVRSTHVIRTIYRQTEGKLPIVGVGGVFTAADALEKLRAGACLVQLYTGLIYRGPSVAREINQGLLATMAADNLSSVQELVGRAVTA